jgi:hypothetical protein
MLRRMRMMISRQNTPAESARIAPLPMQSTVSIEDACCGPATSTAAEGWPRPGADHRAGALPKINIRRRGAAFIAGRGWPAGV